MKPRVAPRRGETTIGVGILCVLAAIAGGVYLRHLRFNNAVLSPDLIARVAAAPGPAAAAGPGRAVAAPFPIPPGLVALSPPENFGADTLSDKIDGKAELYLPAGFVALTCQRLAEPGNPGAWLEVFRFDMGSARNAFAVFSAQRRPEAEPLAVTPLAYQTANALFFIAGQHYLEIIAADTSETLRAGMLELARALAATLGTSEEASPELALLPADGLQRDTVELLAADAFGFDRLDQILIARYDLGAGPATAFVSPRASPEAAATLATAYRDFLLANGGAARAVPPELPGVSLIEIMGSYEIVFARGRVFAGVHAAASREAAGRLAVSMLAHLDAHPTAP